MSKKIKIILLIILIILTAGLGSFALFSSPVNSQATEIKYFNVNENETVIDILNNLEKDELIKSAGFARVYVKFSSQDNFKAGTYEFKQAYNLSEIIKILNEGSNAEVAQVVFQEGLRIIDYADIVEDSLGVNRKEFLDLCNDQDYIDELASKYELIDQYKFNKDTIYMLEGLFAPDTYLFQPNTSPKVVINTLIEQSNKLYLENIKLFEESKLSLNDVYTLGSIVEAEAKTFEDRKLVASIFMNRIDQDIPLGSDVTTYYGLQIGMSERDLTVAELEENNGYNTRSPQKLGLPIGPINSPNFESIKAVLTYEETDYLYFVSDKNSKIYAAKTYDEHNSIIEDLKEKDLWFTY